MGYTKDKIFKFSTCVVGVYVLIFLDSIDYSLTIKLLLTNCLS